MQKTGKLVLDQQDRRVVTTLLLVFLLALVVHYLAINLLDEYESSSQVLQQSQAANELLRNLDHHLVALESSVRSFIIFEEEKYSVSSKASIDQIRVDLLTVRDFFEDSTKEVFLVQLETLVEKKIKLNQNVLDSYQQGGKVVAAQMLNGDEGIQLRDSIIAITDSLRQYHQLQIDSYLSQKQKASNYLRTFSWLAVIVVFLITFFSIFYLIKTSRRRYQAELEKAQKQHELEQNLNFIRDLYQNAPIGFHSVDADGIIIEINQTELDWLGYTREEVVGKMKVGEITSKSPESSQKVIGQLMKTGKLDNLEGQLLRKDGSLLSTISNSRVAYNEQGQVLYARVALMDFTAQKKMREDLKKARELAEQSGALKEQFVANMSHEIRTPLNAILGFSSLLQRSELRGNQKEFVHSIQTSSQNLLSIINDILDFSKIEAGAIHIEQIPFSLPSLIHSLENMFRYRADEKNLQFEVLAEEALPDALLGDPTRLTQILINLLGNAFKFTSEGGIRLHIEEAKRENGDVTVRFTVSDTGIGIPPDKQGAIFERFGQASADTTRRFGGAGLGLTISKQLVDLQGGIIWVESEEGKGTAFMVEIPYTIAESVPEKHMSKVQAGSFKNQQVSILVVEDNPMNSRIVGLLLDEWGFQHEYAENGQIALDKLRRQVFDLVLMDIQMPILDGYQATQRIRQELHLPVPIIATTAHAFAGEREKVISYGMNDYISKPIKEDELMSLILRYVRKKPATKPKYSAARHFPNDPAGFDRQSVIDVSRGKLEAMREMIDLFISQSAKELEQMALALQMNNFGNAANAAHSMRSTAGYMGFAATLGELLSQFEQEAQSQRPDATVLENLFVKIKAGQEAARQFLDTDFFEA